MQQKVTLVNSTKTLKRNLG